MNFPLLDSVNAAFETFGAWSAWANVKRLRRDKEVKGVVWQFTIIWQLWGVWNIWYYYGLQQWYSWTAGMILCAGNTVWIFTMARVLHERKVSDSARGS
jgi:hypothetical protein